jgi:catalase
MEGVGAGRGRKRCGLLERLRAAVEKEGGRIEVIAPKAGGAHTTDGKWIAADHALAAAPSILFDALVVATAGDASQRLAHHPAAVDWVRDAFAHLKVIGHVAGAAPLLEHAGVEPDDGLIALASAADVRGFVAAAKGPRIWAREQQVEQRVEGNGGREGTARRR